MKKKTLVVSALPYANGPFHLGHMVEFIQADVFVRFLKLKDKDVIYCCADDTHGTPIEIKAKEQGITPEELISKYFQEHQKDLVDFGIQFDNYYTTNSPENKAFSEYIFQKAKDKGYIYQKEVEQLYCPTCVRFLPDRFIKGICPKCKAEDQYGDVCEKCGSFYEPIELINPYCSLCKSKQTKPILKKSNHYFFKLTVLKNQLTHYLLTSNFQQEIVNFITNWLEKLDDWCISRDGPYFGFKIPGEENKYFYVWLDAPIGYISSTANYCQKNNLDVSDYWRNEQTEIIQFIGKDIVYFHFLFWPALLMTGEFTLPKQIRVHGFLTVNNEKMSKSRGTFITARQYLQHLPPELLRFYFSSNLTSKVTDLDFDLSDFVDKVNNELIANVANFTYRVISFLNNNCHSKITVIGNHFNELHYISEIEKKFALISNHYESGDYREAVKEILAISSLGNKYMQETEPWKLIKNNSEQTVQVLTFCVNILRNLSILFMPIMPKMSLELQHQLQLQNLQLQHLSWNDLHFKLENHTIGKGEPLFKKLELENIHLISKKFPFEIRVAEIVSVQNHPNAERLYHLKINLGTEQRELVAGVREHYTAEQLLHKKVMVLCNLEPADIRGIKSNGMILMLVTENGKKIKLLEPILSKVGELVYTDHKEYSFAQISYNEFKKIMIISQDHKIICDGKAFRTDSEVIGHQFEDNGTVQ